MSTDKRSRAPGKPAKKPPKGSYDGVGTTGSASSAGGAASTAGVKNGAGRARVAPPQQADVGEIARAVSTGLTLIVLGGLVQPVVTKFVPFLGVIWLILVAVGTFAYVGFRGGRAGPNPPVYGAGTAVGSFLLVIPVMFLVGTFNPVYAVSTLVTAAVVGAVAGVIGARTNTGR